MLKLYFKLLFLLVFLLHTYIYRDYTRRNLYGHILYIIMPKSFFPEEVHDLMK